MEVPPELTTSRAEFQAAVDFSFTTLAIDTMYRHGLRSHPPAARIEDAVEVLRAARRRGVFPSFDGVQMVVDELAGRPIVPERRRRTNDDS